jgi:glycosyltransferase involved in cell wall biosynthesis
MTAVSVVMAAFNAERYVGAAIDSILAQSMPPSEIIVVDDGSTDNTRSVLQSYGEKLVVISQTNQGPALAMNRAISAASGDLLGFLDADDLWTDFKLELQVALLSTKLDVDAVFGLAQQFISEDLTPDEARRHLAIRDPQPGISKNTMLIRRDAFERVGYFDTEFRYIEFFDWYFRATEIGLKTETIPRVFTKRRLHLTNTGLRTRTEQRAENMAALKRALDRRRGTN